MLHNLPPLIETLLIASLASTIPQAIGLAILFLKAAAFTGIECEVVAEVGEPGGW